MNPNTFIDDFERTEHSDALYSILGRALAIGTRFDAMCKAAALHVQFKNSELRDQKERSELFGKLAAKFRSLNLSIKDLGLPKDVAVLLEDANVARNSVAHDLAKGMTGCLDTRIDQATFVREVSDLIFEIAYGDVVISQIIAELNGEQLPNNEFLSTYVQQVVRWVVEE
jgi:hypothetical protein